MAERALETKNCNGPQGDTAFLKRARQYTAEVLFWGGAFSTRCSALSSAPPGLNPGNKECCGSLATFVSVAAFTISVIFRNDALFRPVAAIHNRMDGCSAKT